MLKEGVNADIKTKALVPENVKKKQIYEMFSLYVIVSNNLQICFNNSAYIHFQIMVNIKKFKTVNEKKTLEKEQL